jgi:hypothetical protein
MRQEGNTGKELHKNIFLGKGNGIELSDFDYFTILISVMNTEDLYQAGFLQKHIKSVCIYVEISCMGIGFAVLVQLL